MDTEKIDFIESLAGEKATNDSNKKKMDDAKFKGINLDGTSPAVKAWFAAKKTDDKFKGKEI